ncbi:hypothetical protein COCCADRAFT_23846 [Bipolaris zeicola 26-R-13]|uniref:Uncharacterized protein n=1 Tax=Cochliobolus carbonum (strain 26-R-13) TaxID=930089 RepID=W6YY91_COCC2|nr:uncharacterized protein COCCADRAFT_23846 [Bipolaris zeicola 26-R-13]EUC36416.1 hypothetical protein COCCADRAFT_23846 [Bipolaris zeicola 26-R-13]
MGFRSLKRKREEIEVVARGYSTRATRATRAARIVCGERALLSIKRPECNVVRISHATHPMNCFLQDQAGGAHAMRYRGTLCEKKQQDLDQWPSRIAIFSPKASVEGVIGSQKKRRAVSQFPMGWA